MELGGERDGEVTAAAAAAVATAAVGLLEEDGFCRFGLVGLHSLVWTNQFGQIGLGHFILVVFVWLIGFDQFGLGTFILVVLVWLMTRR